MQKIIEIPLYDLIGIAACILIFAIIEIIRRKSKPGGEEMKSKINKMGIITQAGTLETIATRACKNCIYFTTPKTPAEKDLPRICMIHARMMSPNDTCGVFQPEEQEATPAGNEETCAACGSTIPEGRQVCPECESGAQE